MKKDIDDLELTLAKVEKEKHATENKVCAKYMAEYTVYHSAFNVKTTVENNDSLTPYF